MRAVIGLALVVLVAGCSPYPQSSTALQVQVNALAAQETAVAQATRSAYDNQARATAQALDLQAQATRTATDAVATQTAANTRATAVAWSFESTRTAAEAQATRTSADAAATATSEAIRAQARSTAIAATAQAIERQNERERVTQPLRTFGPWLLLLAGLIVAAVVGFYGWRLFEDRMRLVRRNPDEGEPVMILSRERLALPLRSFGNYTDLTHGQERAPLLAPTIEAQEAATMRQQTANAIQARQVGQVAEAKSRGRTDRVMVLSPRATTKTRASTEPGLLGVQAVGALDEATTAGLLAPGLAEAIEAQWREVEVE